MTIFDNIENFDIAYTDVDLSEDDEIRLLENLREAADALVPLRSSKMKTRLYFKKHFLATPKDTDLHTRLDTKGDLFLSAFYSVLIDVRYSFGFIVNLLPKNSANAASPTTSVPPSPTPPSATPSISTWTTSAST